MDKQKSFLNITVSFFSHILLLIVAVIVRRMLIQNIGNYVNGLNSLYSSFIGMLTVAELGVGRAIVYSMYRPIVAGDKSSVAALFNLYHKLYAIIGGVIFIGGLLVMPFIPRLISDYEVLDVNVYTTFFLTLISVVLTYLYSAKTSLIEAHKDNYITTGIAAVSYLTRYALQIAVILTFRSFIAFLICQIIGTVIVWTLTEIVVQKEYTEIINTRESVDERAKKEIRKNVKAIFMHKIGSALVNTVDSLIISAFIGVVILGKYSNYTLIAGVVVSIINLFFTPLTSVVGHLYAAGDIRETKRWFNYFYSLNFILGVVFFLGYYAVIDYVVKFCFGAGLEVTRSIAFIITLNQFTMFLRRTALLFRDASGTFYYDRWKPIGEGICNLVLSLLFVQVFPEELRVVGVIVATIVTTLLICHIVDPYVVYKYAFHMSVKEYYLRNYSYIGLFFIALIGLERLMQRTNSDVAGILLNGFISLGVSFLLLALVVLVDKSFRNSVKTMCRAAVRWLRLGQ